MNAVAYEHAAQLVAHLLLDTGSVKTRNETEEAFTLKNGNRSPIYIDCRHLISDIPAMNIIAGIMHQVMKDKCHLRPDRIVGGETAGMPYAANLSHQCGIPFLYVRKAEKEHGLRGLVVGQFTRCEKVLLVEDLITDGGSKRHFIEAIRAEHLRVDECFVVFDRQQGGETELNQLQVKLVALATMNDLLRAIEDVYPASFTAIQSYLADPQEWHRKRGFQWFAPKEKAP